MSTFNLNEIREQACVACKAYPPSDPDHIKTRGAGGTDEEFNLWPLCRPCHTQKHKEGIRAFLERHRHLERALVKKGWEKIYMSGDKWKYIHPIYRQRSEEKMK